MAKGAAHRWEFRARFRRRAFGWRSQPAIKRTREAVSEIKKAARNDQILAAEGAVLFLEKVSAALEAVDSSSGAIGTAVNNAVKVLADIIATAPVADETREKWLDRLFDAHEADQIPYIELLAEHWGELCASPEIASRWADRLINVTRLALHPDRSISGHFHGTSACLSSLYAAGRNEELLALLKDQGSWPYKRWAVKALLAQGRKAEAIRLAESSRDLWASDLDIDRLCEEVLLSSGLEEEAYQRYGLRANRAGTYLAWFRAVAKKYPRKKPEFALEAGMAALHWLVEGYGYDITSLDVLNAYSLTLKAAENAGCADTTRQRIHDLVARESFGERFVTKILGRQLGLS